MPDKVRIALDAMGGDHGPAVVLPGAELSLARHPDTEFLLFGDRAAIEPVLDAHAAAESALAGSSTPTSRSGWTTSRARRCAMAAGNPRCGSPSTR